MAEREGDNFWSVVKWGMVALIVAFVVYMAAKLVAGMKSAQIAVDTNPDNPSNWMKWAGQGWNVASSIVDDALGWAKLGQALAKTGTDIAGAVGGSSSTSRTVYDETNWNDEYKGFDDAAGGQEWTGSDDPLGVDGDDGSGDYFKQNM
jgi:hypothetical protein